MGCTPAGLYTPIGHTRTLSVQDGQATALARLASYHEALHGFLNSSTTFGNAMILVGTLVEAGFAQFSGLVQRMVDASRLTHESFATVSALCTATYGRMDDDLLDGDYLNLLHTFRHVFSKETRPFLATVALSSCARAAMQTEIYHQFLGLPCERWIDAVISAPDPRFRTVFRKDTAALAMAAMDQLLEASGEPGRRLVRGVAPQVEHELMVGLGTSMQEALSKASFAVYAAALESAGLSPRPAYDAERLGLEGLIQRIEGYAGPALKTVFRVANGAEDDIDAVLTDYGRETLRIRDEPDQAILVDCCEPLGVSIASFLLPGPERAWLQLVAMPKAKLRTLYRLDHGDAVLLRSPGQTVTGLRRASRAPDGTIQIEFYMLPSEELTRFVQANPATEVVAVVSASTTADHVWRSEWLTPGAGDVVRLLVLIDTDPFKLLRTRSSRGPVGIVVTGMKRDGDDDHVEIVCITADGTPEVLYFTPCSTPFRQAMLEYARRHCSNVTRRPRLDDQWRGLLSRVLERLLREEHCFGVEFWT